MVGAAWQQVASRKWGIINKRQNGKPGEAENSSAQALGKQTELLVKVPLVLLRTESRGSLPSKAEHTCQRESREQASPSQRRVPESSWLWILKFYSALVQVNST